MYWKFEGPNSRTKAKEPLSTLYKRSQGRCTGQHRLLMEMEKMSLKLLVRPAQNWVLLPSSQCIGDII